MKKRFTTLLLISLMVFNFFFVVTAVQAGTLLDDSNAQLGEFGEEGYGQEQAVYLPTIVGNVISVILGTLGIIMVVIFIRAGFWYMTAGGDPAKVDKAKKVMFQTVIGLLICLLSYAITSFVVGNLADATYLS